MKKHVCALLILSMFVFPAFAEEDTIDSPKDLFYRFGTTDTPEVKFDSSQKIDLSTPKFETKPVLVEDRRNENPTYADLSIKKMAMEISSSIEMDYNDMMDDLSLLWQGAAMKSDTISDCSHSVLSYTKLNISTKWIRLTINTISTLNHC